MKFKESFILFLLFWIAKCQNNFYTLSNCSESYFSDIGKVCRLFDYKPFRYYGNGYDKSTTMIIKIEANNLVEIPTDFFNVFYKLYILRAEFCGINNLKVKNFKNALYLGELNLNGNGIKTLPTEAFSNAPNLKAINLQHNQLEDIDVNAFSGVTKIEQLHLQRNKIKKLPTTVFSELIMLKEIDLSKNKLEEIESELFEKTVSLKRMDLSENQINYIHKNAFEKLSLNFLGISKNNLKKISLPNVLNFYASESGLTEINYWSKSDYGFLSMNDVKLNDNNLISIAIPSLKVENLDASNNNLDSFEFLKLNTVTNLDISRNPKAFISEESLADFKNINITNFLNVSSNNLVNVDFLKSEDLRNTVEIDMSNNALKFFDFQILKQYENLRSLDLSNNNLKSINFNGVRNDFLVELKSVNINGNPWNCTDLRQMLKYFKKNHIQTIKGNEDLDDEANFYQFYVAGIGCFLNYSNDINFTNDSKEIIKVNENDLKEKVQKIENRLDILEAKFELKIKELHGELVTGTESTSIEPGIGSD